MLWLQPPPWGRWAAAALILGFALWAELRPEPTVEHPFATETILPGEVLDELNTETRRLPAGLLDPPPPGSVALRQIAAGTPLVAGDASPEGRLVPPGWWIVAVQVPRHAAVGDRVQLVLVDSGQVVPGVVALAPSEDPFDPTPGGVAVEPGAATRVAMAASGDRLVVLVSSG